MIHGLFNNFWKLKCIAINLYIRLLFARMILTTPRLSAKYVVGIVLLGYLSAYERAVLAKHL